MGGFFIKQLFMPKQMEESVLQIDLNKLKAIGIKGLILDLDNTVIKWNSDELEEPIYHWFKLLHAHQFKLCFLSNNFSKRVSHIARLIDAAYVARAWKPFSGGFSTCLEKLNMPAKSVAVIGDQLFTDILGGNCAGIFTILVKPLSHEEFITTKMMRVVENFVLKNQKKS